MQLVASTRSERESETGIDRQKEIRQLARFVTDVLPFLYGQADSRSGVLRPRRKLCSEAIFPCLEYRESFSTHGNVHRRINRLVKMKSSSAFSTTQECACVNIADLESGLATRKCTICRRFHAGVMRLARLVLISCACINGTTTFEHFRNSSSRDERRTVIF